MPERIRFQFPWSPTLERVTEGVWLVRGDFKREMNVYLLEEEGGGVTGFDAGTKPMTKAVLEAAEKLGGLRRVVLGHADSDHRGSAPHLGVPVFVHPADEAAARAPGPFRDYWRLDKIEIAISRWLYKHYLHRRWDGGPIDVAGTVEEGERICGFEVVHFPGHAPGLIGLWRESDGVALVSDTIYFTDSIALKDLPKLEIEGVSGHEMEVPDAVWNWDTATAADSVRKLAALGPRLVGAGHVVPLEGDPETIRRLLLDAADAADAPAKADPAPEPA